MCVMYNDDRGACVLLWLMLFVVVQIYTPGISHLYEHKRGANVTSTLLMQRGSELSREWNGARMEEIGNECIAYTGTHNVDMPKTRKHPICDVVCIRETITIPPNCRILRGWI